MADPDPSQPVSFRSLSSTLIRSIVAAGALCALVVGSLQLALTYQKQRSTFETDVQTIAQLNVPLLSVNLRDIEPDAIRSQLRLIVERPQIAYARLHATSGQEFQSGDVSQHARHGSISLAVPYPAGKQGQLGTLEIVPNWDYLYRELAFDVLTVLVAGAFLTALICCVVAVILRRQLELPMQRIAQFAGSLTPTRLTRPLQLRRSRRRWRDEIDEMAEGFRVLQDDIRRHVEELDDQVAQRTAELKRANERLKAMAERDPLTALANRRSFDQQKLRAWEQMLATRQPLSVLMVDIDYFKQYNDTYGHSTGDDCLITIANVLAQTFHMPGELPVRMGGEEFAVLLENATHTEAIARAEALRAAIHERAVPHEKSVYGRVTVSIGVATASVEDLPMSFQHAAPPIAIAELLGRADQALYEAKGAGRNRVFAVSLSSGAATTTPEADADTQRALQIATGRIQPSRGSA